MKRNNGILFNITFWSLYFLYEWLGLASLYGEYNSYFINACMALPVSLIFSVLVVHVLFPRLYSNNKKTLFWLCILTSSFLLLLMRRYVNYYEIYPRYFPVALHMPFFSPGKFLVEFVNLYVITGLYGFYYLIRFWYEERHRVQELTQQKTLAELNLLKAQVQPHFVFNTLNNIYATALKSSPETAGLIAHLSGLLDYNLYDASKEKTPLEAEIAYIEHYVELQKNRYGSRLDVAINVHNNVKGIPIVPLLLLPLVENCFKHGVGNSIGKSWVRIDVRAEKGRILIGIENSREKITETTETNGIGLSNVRKRLQLLYPGKHEMEIVEGSNSYLVILKITIEQDDKMFDS